MRGSVEERDCGTAVKVVNRGVIHESAILRPDKDTAGQVEVGPAAVNERRASLRIDGRCVQGIKDQGGDAGEGEGLELFHWVSEDVGARDFVIVVPQAQGGALAGVTQRVP